MTKEQAEKVLDELQKVRPEVLNGEAKRLFEAIMKIADEREEAEQKLKAVNKGMNSLMESRKKWKHKYYKMKNENKDLQKSVEQIYNDYQDIGKITFNYLDEIEEQEKAIYRLKVHKGYVGINKDCCIANVEDIETVLSMLKEQDKIIDLMAEEISKNILNTCSLEDYNYDLDCENKCNDNYKKCWKQYFKNKAKEIKTKPEANSGIE